MRMVLLDILLQGRELVPVISKAFGRAADVRSGSTEVALSTGIPRVVLESASPIKRACRGSRVRQQLDRVLWACEAKAASDISDC